MSDYAVTTIKLYKNGDTTPKIFILETFNESKKLQEIKIHILQNIDKIIEKGWGKFSKDFISHHILKANRLKLVRDGDKIVALAAASLKEYNNHKLLYLEFTLVSPEYQGYALLVYLNGTIIIGEMINRVKRLNFKKLDVITITRNPRVLATISHFASYMYPNPKQFQKMGGKLMPSNIETWDLLNAVLKDSWNPKRTLLREGSVLLGSYLDMPWLITPTIQKHYLTSAMNMAEKYLAYKSHADKEFMVHAKISVMAIPRFIYWKFRKTSKR